MVEIIIIVAPWSSPAPHLQIHPPYKNISLNTLIYSL